MTEETETKPDAPSSGTASSRGAETVTPTASQPAARPVQNQPTATAAQGAAAQGAARDAARDAALEERAVRRGCFSIIFGAVLGAMVGAALTLALLAWMNNGLLTYNDADVTLRRQLDGEIATREVVLEQLVSEQATAVFAMNEATNRMNATMGTAEADMAALRVTAVYLETRIADAGNAADTLNTFLGGLDGLLSNLTPAATAVPQATPEP